MIESPVELLQKKKNELERDLEKSWELYINYAIGQDIHMMHKRNLEPKIKEYQTALNKLLEL